MTRSAVRMIAAWFALPLLLSGFAGGWASARAVHDEATPEASPMASPVAGMDMGAGTGTGAAYMTIANGGAQADRLLGGSTGVAGVVEIHDMKIDGGVMTMIPLLDGLEIPAGGSVALEPQGYHVMLINLTQDLRSGDRFDLTLRFERAGDVIVPVTVGGEAPADAPPVLVGSITIDGAWSRPAPMLSAETRPASTSAAVAAG